MGPCRERPGEPGGARATKTAIPPAGPLDYKTIIIRYDAPLPRDTAPIGHPPQDARRPPPALPASHRLMPAAV